MNLALKIVPVEANSVRSDEDRILAFLNGETNGEDVLHDLYDHVLDEPIPAQMLAILRG